MKAIFISCVLLLVNVSVNAQQNFLKFAESSYLPPSQMLTKVSEINSFRNQLDVPGESDAGIHDNSTYFKVYYNPSEGTSVPGLVFIGYSNRKASTSNFEKEGKVLYDLVLVDNDDSLAVTETFKYANKNGAYAFIKGDQCKKLWTRLQFTHRYSLV